MSNWNRAFSAPKGYDLRAPYNVPLGEIWCMRVVPGFSVSTLQKDSIAGVCDCREECPCDMPEWGQMMDKHHFTYYCNPCTRYMCKPHANGPTVAQITIQNGKKGKEPEKPIEIENIQ